MYGFKCSLPHCAFTLGNFTWVVSFILNLVLVDHQSHLISRENRARQKIIKQNCTFAHICSLAHLKYAQTSKRKLKRTAPILDFSNF